MSRDVAIVNQKGGSGKTTTAVNLAAALGERGEVVLVVDLDPQASASNWYGVRDAGRGLLDVFTNKGNLKDIITRTGAPGVDIIPSSSWLVGVEKALAGQTGAEKILRRELRTLRRTLDYWDYVLVDCPPTLGVLTVNALTAVQEVLVPVEAHVLALQGVSRLIETVDVVKDRLNPELRVTGILACRVSARTRHAQEVVEQLRTHFGDLVYRTVIRENVRLAECPSFGQPITQYDSRSAGAEDYRSLAAELVQQEGSRQYAETA